MGQSRRIVFLFLLIFFLLKWGIPFESLSYADSWKLHRTNREKIIIRRLKKILRKDPFSSYAFRRLLRYHRKKSQIKALLKEYLELSNRYPQILTYKVLLARLYRHLKDNTTALFFYKMARQIAPKHPFLILGEADLLLKLGETKKALLLYRLLVQLDSKNDNKRVLWKILKESLKLKQITGVTFAWKRLRRLPLRVHERLRLARLLGEHGYYVYAVGEYRKSMKVGASERNLKILLEILRLQIKNKLYRQALITLRRARAIKTKLTWVKKELLQQEIAIYRAQKRLPYFFEHLMARWISPRKKLKSFDKATLLARLAYEIHRPSLGIHFDQLALRLRPAARAPRLRLIKIFEAQKARQAAFQQMRLLIKYKQAAPEHYLKVARSLLQRSGRLIFVTRRWHPRWSRRRICRSARIGRPYFRGYRYRLGRRVYRRGYLPRFACSKKTWRAYRIARLKEWMRSLHYSETRKRHFQEALRILKLCLHRFPSDWSTLKELEEIFDQQGMYEFSQRALQLLIKATPPRPKELLVMRQLLIQLQKLPLYRKLIIKALRRRNLNLLQAFDLVSFVYGYWQQRRDQPPKSSFGRMVNDYVPPKIWTKKPCRPLKGLLTRTIAQIDEVDTKNYPFVVLRMTTFAKLCHLRGKHLERLHAETQKILAYNEDAFPHLFAFYARYHFDEGIAWILKHIFRGKRPEWILEHLMPIFQRYKIKTYTSILRQLYKQFPQNPDLAAHVMLALCRHKRTCRSATEFMDELITDKKVSPLALMKVIEALALYHLRMDDRLKWMKILIKRYWNHPAFLNWMAEHRLLKIRASRFYTDQKRYISLVKLKGRLLLRVLSLRVSEPMNIKRWRLILVDHLLLLFHRFRLRRDFMQRLEPLLDKFPTLRRKIVEFYLSRSSFRPYGIKLFKKILLHNPTTEDFWSLSSYFSYLGRDRLSFLIRVVKKLNRLEDLAIIEFFASKRKSRLALRIAALKRMIQIKRTHDPLLMRRLSRSLDALGRFEEADLYAARSIAHDKRAPRKLRRAIRLCCADLASENDTRRLFLGAVSQRSLAQFWPETLTLLQKLSPVQAHLFTIQFLRRYELTATQSLTFAQALEKKNLPAIAVRIYLKLFKKKGLPTESFYRLALLLDQLYRFKEAERFWKIYAEKKKITFLGRYFAAQAQLHLGKHDKELARIFFYRSYASRGKHALLSLLGWQEEHRAIEKLRKNGEALKAWGRWLWVQRDIKKCLKPSRLQPFSYALARQLWMLNTEYRGVFSFFQRCRWELSDKAREQLKELVKFMKKNPKFILNIAASSDPSEEPDTAFLARQRVLSLQWALMKRGIPPRRIKLLLVNGQSLCLPMANERRCHRYRRQLFLGSRPLSLGQFLTNDVDLDKIKDFADECPFIRYFNRPYRRRYRHSARFLFFSNLPLQPSYRRTLFLLRTKPLLGCPPNSSQRLLLLKGLHRGIIELRQKIHFYRYNYSLMFKNRKVLKQLAAYLKAAPHLQRITVVYELPDRPNPRARIRRRFNSRYYYRRNRSYGTFHTRWVAIRRVQRIVDFLVRHGVSAQRLRYKIVKKHFPPHSSIFLYRSPIIFKVSQKVRR